MQHLHCAGMAPSSTPRPSHRSPSPRSLDVAAFCREGASIEGQWSLTELPRLVDSLAAGEEGAAGAAVQWRAAGSLQTVAGRAGVCTVDLEVHAVLALECQRCLQPMHLPLDLQRRLRFVAGEEEAARLDEELEDDVLALSPRTDLRELVEDELLLALPLVPRHGQCPHGSDTVQAAGEGPAGTGEAGQTGGGEHPFAALAAWRKGPPRG